MPDIIREALIKFKTKYGRLPGVDAILIKAHRGSSALRSMEFTPSFFRRIGCQMWNGRGRRCFLIIAFICLGACGQVGAGTTVTFRNPDQTESPAISVEVVASQESRNRGLMYRQKLGETEGMLFIFPDSAPRSFWMKNTYVELDIVFLDEQMKVVSVSEKAVPLTESPRPSKGSAKFVLEVKGGMAKQWNVVPGSVLQVEGELPSTVS